jgi:hypothetical protein
MHRISTERQVIAASFVIRYPNFRQVEETAESRAAPESPQGVSAEF